jgi:hypothetical protein
MDDWQPLQRAAGPPPAILDEQEEGNREQAKNFRPPRKYLDGGLAYSL